MDTYKLRAVFALLILTAFTVVILAAPKGVAADVDAISANCRPRAGQVAFFQHEQYGGQCRRLQVGSYPSSIAFRLPDNYITSLKVGADVRAVLFTERDFKGSIAIYDSDVPNLFYEPIGNDTVSSIRVEPRDSNQCKARRNQVAAFEHEQFDGRCIVKEAGRYSSSDLIGLPDNFITALQVRRNMRVILYSEPDFTGDVAVYEQNVPNLYYEPIGNDTVSSMVVERRASTRRHQCRPSKYQVVFFEHEQYDGLCIVKDIGEFRNAFEIGLPDDFITSFRVGRGVQVTLYADEDFGGDSATYTSNVPNLWYEPFGNDRVSSLKISSR